MPKGISNKAMLEAIPEALENILARRARERVGEVSLREYLEGAVVEDTQGEGGVRAFELWPHLVETLEAWESGRNEIILKARQLGFSSAVALYAGRVARVPGNLVLLLSQGQDESFELLRKVRVGLVEHRRYPALLSRDGSGVLEVAGGGRVIALPSTPKAGRGYTARLVVSDEAGMHPFAKENFAGYRNTIADGGQHLVISTANGQSGWFAEQWKAAIGGESGYEPRFYPWWVRPGRDEGWYERERRAFTGMEELFKQENPASAEEAFVGLEGLVYPEFRADLHVRGPEIGWSGYKWRVAGVDFGGGDPTAVVPLGVDKRERVWQVGEFYKRGAVTLEDIADYLWKMHDVGPFDAILCDPSEPVAIATLKAMGLPAYAADKDRSQGLQWVSWLLREGRLYVSPLCRNSINEFYNYRWRERTDSNSKDRFATSTPVDHHGDGMDARRYGVMHIIRSVMRGSVAQRWSVEIEG